MARIVQGYTIPKRAHHPLCNRNKRTKGFGVISQPNLATAAEEKRLKELFEKPLNPSEKASSKHCTKEATTAFFAPRKKVAEVAQVEQLGQAKPMSDTTNTIDFCKSVMDLIADASFAEKHKAKSAPLAMIAFAGVVVDKVIRSKQCNDYFTAINMTAPPSPTAINNPQYHSIVGQRLLHVEWNQTFGINIGCPDRNCKGVLKNDRTNYSKNKTLFPLFGLDGPPAWCIIMKMTCQCCKRQFDSNSPEVLLSLPAYASNQYPVETKFALTNHSFHLTREATNVLDSLMLTYGN